MSVPDDMEDIIKNFQQKIETLETQIKRLRVENQTLANKAREADNRYGDNTLETQTLKSEIESMRDMLKKSDDERDKLRKKVTELSKVSRMSDEDKSREVDRLKDKVAAMDRILQKSGHEVKDLNARIPILVQEKQDLRDEVTRLKQEKGDLEKDIQAIQNQGHSVEMRLKVKEEELDHIKLELEDVKSQNNADERIQTIDSLEKLNHKLKLEIQSQRQAATSAERRLKELEEQASILRHDLEDQVEELEKAMLDVGRYKDTNKRLESENDILMSESEELRDQIRSMIDNKVELSIVKDQKERLGEDNLLMRDKIADLTERLGTMEETAKSLMLMTKEKQRHNEDFMNEINKLQSDKEAMRNQLEHFEKQRRRGVKFDEREIELPMKGTEKMGEKDLRTSLKRLQDENKRLRTMLAMKNMSEQNGITQVTEMQAKLGEKEEELAKVRARQKRLEAWMDEIFHNKKYQLILQDEYDRLEDRVGQTLPTIPKNGGLVSPGRTPPGDEAPNPLGPLEVVAASETPRTLATQGANTARSVAPTPAFSTRTSQKPPPTGYSTARGRLNGTYSRLK